MKCATVLNLGTLYATHIHETKNHQKKFFKIL